MSNELSSATQKCIVFKPNGSFEQFDQILVKGQNCSMIEMGNMFILMNSVQFTFCKKSWWD